MVALSTKTLALVISAIKELCESKGSTSREILNYITAIYNIPPESARRQMVTALKRGVDYGILRKNGAYYSLPTDTRAECQEIATQELGLLDRYCKRKQRKVRSRGCKPRRPRSSGCRPKRARSRGCRPKRARSRGCKSKRTRSSGCRPKRQRSRGCKVKRKRSRGCKKKRKEKSGACKCKKGKSAKRKKSRGCKSRRPKRNRCRRHGSEDGRDRSMSPRSKIDRLSLKSTVECNCNDSSDGSDSSTVSMQQRERGIPLP